MGIVDLGANELTRAIHKRQEDKQQRLYCFVKTAMGDQMCLAEPANGRRLSFNTIYLRVRDFQRADPDWAEECGLLTDDPEQSKKLRKILNEMCAKNLLKYHIFGNTWSVVS
jgi:hypothetical protein